MANEGLKQKLTAILSADVKDYSRLLSQDRVSTINTLNAHRDLFAAFAQQYGGRIVDTPGDNILMVLESVSDAVNCAAEIQRELAERNAAVPSARMMQWRIGLELGDVVEKDDKIYGDGINIAARIEGLAEPGSICISGTVHEKVRGKLGLEYEDLGEKAVKNVPEPIRVYSVLLKPNAKIEMKESKKSVPSEKPSIAVLPFVNMSNDPEQEYFSDGISEDILNGLAKNPGLDVIARTSSFHFKGQNIDIREISRQLNATHILEGSVRKSANRIRITAQLVSADKGTHLWSEQYNRELIDVFEVQDEISDAILNQLNIHLLDSSVKQKSPANIEAYNAYLLGRYHHNHRNLDEAVAELEKAMSLDPNNADIYGLLSRTHNLYITFNFIPAKEKLPLVSSYADKALSLNQKQLDAIIIKLGLKIFLEHAYQDVINEFSNLLLQQPNEIDMLLNYAYFLRIFRRNDLAFKINNRVVELDPLSPTVCISFGFSFLEIENYDEAWKAFERAEMLGIRGRVPMQLARIAFLKDDLEALQKLLDSGQSNWDDVIDYTIYEAAASYLKGDHNKVKAILATLWQTSSHLSFFQKAEMALLERDLDRAFNYYEQAISELEYVAILFINNQSIFKKTFPDYKSHPRWQKMLHDVGLDDESIAKLKIPPLPF